MKNKSSLTYVPPRMLYSHVEGEGIICLSATVTVDEVANMNIPESGSSASPEPDYFEFN